jgi:nucleoid-associated protein YgaU
VSIPAKGTLIMEVGDGSMLDFIQLDIQYNPTELSFEKQAQIAEITIPGLDAPIQQFVRGNAEKLTLEIFCDTTDDGTGVGATSVTRETDKFYQLTKIIPSRHAPPTVTFSWNSKFPGSELDEKWGNQRRNSFTGVAESVRQRFTMFSVEGVPLRATVTLVLREYRTLQEQLYQLNLTSPDRTHSHVLAAGETLTAVAARYYGSPADWRRIADENGIEDPRRLQPGLVLSVPKIDQRARR